MNIEATTAQTPSGITPLAAPVRANAQPSAIDAMIATRPDHLIGRKQTPINTVANASTIVARNGPKTVNKPTSEMARKSGFLKRNGAR